MNILRKKLENKELIRGTLVSLTDPCLCEIMGNVGFDCVWIDTEHTYMSYKDVLCHLNASHSSGIASLVRLPQNDLTATKKILEMGPDAIVFPMVRSCAEFESLMEMTLYPPLGTRGFGPMRAIGYNPQNSREYVKDGHLELCRFMQIESVSMIDELEKIADNPYVDGFIFGPNDLSGSLGDFLNVFDEPTVNQVKRAIEIIKRHGKLVGLACGFNDSEVRFWCDLGLDMIFAGGDWTFLYKRAADTLDLLNSLK